MAWDVEAKKTAIKTIGTVETGMKYDGINYRDPITVGMMQWYGTRAANILNLMRATPAWVGVASSLTNDLASKAETNGGFWTSRYLTRAEGGSLRPVLKSQTGVRIQHAKTLDDLDDYKYQGERVGLNADTQTDQFIYFAVMYHQSPKFARQVMNSARSNPTLERIHSIALNHQWYSKFKSRQNTAYQMIKNKDNSGIPDFGLEEGAPPPTGPPATEDDDDENEPDWDHGGPSSPDEIPAKSSVVVELVGNALHVTLEDRKIICQPTNTGRLWRSGSDSRDVVEVVPPTPADPDDDEPVPPVVVPPPVGGGGPNTPGTKLVPVTANPEKVVTYKGKKYSGIFRDAFMSWEHACNAEGIPLVATQGGYNKGGVAASAGTHDKDGVDVSVRNMSQAQCARAIVLGRERGIFAFFRAARRARWGVPGSSSFKIDHIHAGPNGWGYPSRPMAVQKNSYRTGDDALKGTRLYKGGPGDTLEYVNRTWPDFVALYR